MLSIIEYYLKEIFVLFLGMAPLSELRGAIPVGILIFNFTSLKTFLLAVVGNIIPVFPIYFIVKKISDTLIKKYKICEKFFDWLFEYTRKRHGKHFDKWQYAPLALFVFVAIPLPMTGAWSGVLVGIVFGLSLKEIMFSIIGGILTAGIIVTILTNLGLLTANTFLF